MKMAVRVAKVEGAGCRVEDGGFGVELCHVCKVQAILPSDKGDTRVVHVPWNISGDTLPSRVYSIPSSFSFSFSLSSSSFFNTTRMLVLLHAQE